MDQKLLNTKERPLKHPTKCTPCTPGVYDSGRPLLPAGPEPGRGPFEQSGEKEGGISNDTSLDCQGLQALVIFGKPSRTKRKAFKKQPHSHSCVHTHTHTLLQAPFCSWDPNGILSVPRVYGHKESPGPSASPYRPPASPSCLHPPPDRPPRPHVGCAGLCGAMQGGDRARSVGRKQGVRPERAEVVGEVEGRAGGCRQVGSVQPQPCASGSSSKAGRRPSAVTGWSYRGQGRGEEGGSLGGQGARAGSVSLQSVGGAVTGLSWACWVGQGGLWGRGHQTGSHLELRAAGNFP